ncbi:uncharacterized protein LOC142179835 [Nicotiana tabacum]|uniref:Uncharacterized protein LOC142179835 n=1 Tax=Nicotiana tabacum TaxID=4097 RepID=A0AC58UBG1_TOBAC
MEGLLRLQLTRDPFNWPICDIETVTSQIAVVLDLFFCRKVKQKVATKGSISSRALDLDVVFFYLINSARPILYLGDFTGIIQVVRSQDRLKGFDPEPKRTFHRRLRKAKDTNNLQALIQFPVNMEDEQHMTVQEVAMPSIANVTSSIVKPRITGHFELKQSMIQLLHAIGQFMGPPHEDPQQHILNFLEISDTYITNGVTLDYKFLARYFPSGKIAKIRSEIVAFKQKVGESLYSAWERFKGLLRDFPHHNQTNEVLAYTFIEGLHPETKIVVDTAAGGQVLEKSFDEIYVLLNKFSKSNPDWQGEMSRHTMQKSSRILEGQTNQYGNTYNPNWRNHPNFSWGGNQVGDLPSDTEANPKESINVVSLRNGRQLEEVQSKKRKQVTFNEKLATIESESENIKGVQINIPLVDILQEVPKYAKYIKDIVTNKRRLTEFEIVALTEECSSRIQSKLPQKLKDPGSFTIQISIGKYVVVRALCDLGASINLMSLSVFRQLGLGDPRPTTVILQLADRSLAHPEEVIEDALVQVGSFIFPADFIILD